MACSKCDYKGYKETETAYSGKLRPAVKQCFDCNDIEAYSARVKKVMDLWDLERAAENRSEIPQPKKPKLKLVEDE